MENMDCLSQKIELSFSVGLNTKIGKQLTSTSNYKLLVDIEGVFQIYIYGQLFFDDPYILLFELGLELSKWRKKTEYEQSVDFSYKTMDYDDEPILLFKKCMDKKNWKISSIWQLFEFNEEIEHELLMNAVDNFLNELEIQLFEFYNLNFKDYLDNV